MWLYVLFCLIGFVLLYYGAEWLVKGSSSLARSMGLTPLVIGLTVVAFGTSAPELVVSVVCSVQGKCMIAVGNVIGSNICNIALVLGTAALFHPITTDPSVVRRDIPIMLGVSLYLFVLSLNGQIGRIEGVTLFAGVILYTLMNYRFAKHAANIKGSEEAALADMGVEEVEYIQSRRRQIVLIVIGVLGVTSGAEIVVDSAEVIMRVLGVSEKFIGLTIVAFGTSLPELATSVVAAIRKEMDISIGNLVGSNVFNILSVLGVASMIAPIPIPGGLFDSGLYIDYGVMLFTSFLPLVMLWRHNTITRLHGAILLSCYVGFLAYLIVGQ